MKITLLIGSLSGGGAERVTCNLANFLAGKGHEVTVLTLSDKQTYFLDEKVRHIVLYGESHTKLPHFCVNVLRMLNLNRYLRKERQDAYVTFLPKLTKVLLMQRKLVKCPIILTERNDPEVFYNGSVSFAKEFDRYYHLADGYVFQTEHARDYYASKGINVENAAVIANAINPEFVGVAYTGPREKHIVGAGRLAEQKNFPLLIQAFAKICHKHPAYQLVIYGEGGLRKELDALCQSLHISGSVQLPGRVNDLGERLKKSAMFVLSSDYEGMPNALMEAMALGLPCVSTDCGGGGAKFLIRHGENGLLVPQKDVDAMAQAMDKILSDEEFAKKLGGNARALQNTLAPGKIYGRWEQFIYQVVKRSSKR